MPNGRWGRLTGILSILCSITIGITLGFLWVYMPVVGLIVTVCGLTGLILAGVPRR